MHVIYYIYIHPYSDTVLIKVISGSEKLEVGSTCYTCLSICIIFQPYYSPPTSPSCSATLAFFSQRWIAPKLSGFTALFTRYHHPSDSSVRLKTLETYFSFWPCIATFSCVIIIIILLWKNQWQVHVLFVATRMALFLRVEPGGTWEGRREARWREEQRGETVRCWLAW